MQETRRIYFRLVGLFLGAFFGTLHGFSSGFVDLFWKHSTHTQSGLRLYGPIIGSIYCLLPLVPQACFGGIFGAGIGCWTSSIITENSDREKQAEFPPTNPPAEQVWPPPPEQPQKRKTLS